MSNNFAGYSQYYDLLYSDKDYEAEVGYVRSLIDKHCTSSVLSILELGCGTGIHGHLLASQGLEVLGVDTSEEMLFKARGRAAASGFSKTRLDYTYGDARCFRVAKRFDVVISLFHVLSYQTVEADLHAMMKTADVHLEVGGLFVFDFWYGPAVLWQRPSVRIKRLANDEITVTRIADPIVHDQINVVDVNYSVFIFDHLSKELHEIKERHPMRYMFLPEIDCLLAANGFERAATEEWMTRKSPSTDTWGVCVVARKIKA